MNILCKLEIHDYESSTEFFPNFYASIVTKTIFKAKCIRCGRTDKVISTFDEITGYPISTLETSKPKGFL